MISYKLMEQYITNCENQLMAECINHFRYSRYKNYVNVNLKKEWVYIVGKRVYVDFKLQALVVKDDTDYSFTYLRESWEKHRGSTTMWSFVEELIMRILKEQREATQVSKWDDKPFDYSKYVKHKKGNHDIANSWGELWFKQRSVFDWMVKQSIIEPSGSVLNDLEYMEHIIDNNPVHYPNDQCNMLALVRFRRKFKKCFVTELYAVGGDCSELLHCTTFAQSQQWHHYLNGYLLEAQKKTDTTLSKEVLQSLEEMFNDDEEEPKPQSKGEEDAVEREQLELNLEQDSIIRSGELGISRNGNEYNFSNLEEIKNVDSMIKLFDETFDGVMVCQNFGKYEWNLEFKVRKNLWFTVTTEMDGDSMKIVFGKVYHKLKRVDGKGVSGVYLDTPSETGLFSTNPSAQQGYATNKLEALLNVKYEDVEILNLNEVPTIFN